MSCFLICASGFSNLFLWENSPLCYKHHFVSFSSPCVSADFGFDGEDAPASDTEVLDDGGGGWIIVVAACSTFP